MKNIFIKTVDNINLFRFLHEILLTIHSDCYNGQYIFFSGINALVSESKAS